jgi:uncharacterized protein
MPSSAFASFLYPGVKLIESTAGSQIGDTASFSTTYMVGTATQGSYVPNLVVSLADFKNTYLSSPSENSINLFFNNNPNGILYFARTQISASFKATVIGTAIGVYTITVISTVGTVITTAIETVTTTAVQAIDITAAALLTKINSDPLLIGKASARSTGVGIIEITSVGSTPLTVTVSATLTVAPGNNSVASPGDFINTVLNTFSKDENWAQGFLIAPEVFQTLTVFTDRIAVGNAMEQLCQSDGFDWVALIDCGAEVYQSADLLRIAGQAYNTAKGHLAYYAPYLKDLLGNLVPPSAAVAAVAGLRYAKEGFQEPIGGSKYKIQGVTDVAVRYSNTQQSVLNPLGINLLRYFQNRGVLIWGLRTRAFDANYTQLNQRVIMNVVNGTLRRSFDEFPFSAIDGEGVLLHRISETAAAVLRRLWLGKALYGGTEQEAFLVRCNFENNTDDLLSNGQVILECYVACSPSLEKLLVSVIKSPLGQIPAA